MKNCIIFAYLISSSLAFAGEKEDFSIKVRLYRGYPPTEFTALTGLGKIIMEETSNGFLVKSSVYRDIFHMGSTVCLLVHPKLSDAKEQLNRILSRVSSLKPDGQFVEYEVSNPSDCIDNPL